MRISRSASPVPLPSLDNLPPMEKSWALEAEQAVCLHEEDELRQIEKEVEQERDANCCWTSSKRLHIGGDQSFCRREVGEDVSPSNKVSKVYALGLHQNDKQAMSRYSDSDSTLRPTRRKKNWVQGFTSASRCYPPVTQAQYAGWVSRGTEAGQMSARKSETHQESKSKRDRTSVSKVQVIQHEKRGLAIESEDHSFSGQGGLSMHCLKHSRTFANRQGSSYRDKISLGGHLENDKISTPNKWAVKKRSYDSEAYNDVIRKRSDNATAYKADDSSASRENNAHGPRVLDPRRNKGLHVKDSRDWDDGNILHNATPSSVVLPRSSRAVFVDVTNRFELHATPGVKEDSKETDAHRVSQRQRQIEYGRNTLGYERYIELVPRLKRKARDPQTPNPKQVCSKRSWDGQIRKWRRLLHVYDPPCEDGEEIAEDLSVLRLQQACGQEIKSDAAAPTPTLPQRYCETNTEDNRLEEEIVMEDANLTIYDDWMEL
ncbi:hypothetical protein L7F22_067146 [Adiantum nelumboides]|nr:hypothetical protein [Adiantum nelumboides]